MDFHGLRTLIGHRLQRRTARRDVSIVSDDCWGGQFYRSLDFAYATPTVGCWVEPETYLAFIQHISAGGDLTPTVAKSNFPYPVLASGPGRLHFLHDSNPSSSVDAFKRRLSRLHRSNLFFKIDFGKSYRAQDVEKWNSLALPRSVALYPTDSKLVTQGQVHHGIPMPEWTIDGAAMYALSLRHFDICALLSTGTFRCSPFYKIFQLLFLEPRLRQRITPRRAKCEK